MLRPVQVARMVAQHEHTRTAGRHVAYVPLARPGGADLEAVRVALGNAHLSTTDIYLGERPEARDDALQAVQRVLGVA